MILTRRSFLLGSASVIALLALPGRALPRGTIEAQRTEFRLWFDPENIWFVSESGTLCGYGADLEVADFIELPEPFGVMA